MALYTARDRATRGWAGVVPRIDDTRMRLKLYPPTHPAALFNREAPTGDVAIHFEARSGKIVPVECHLLRPIDNDA